MQPQKVYFFVVVTIDKIHYFEEEKTQQNNGFDPFDSIAVNMCEISGLFF